MFPNLKLATPETKTVQQNDITDFNIPTKTKAYKLYATSLEHINWIIGPIKDFERVCKMAISLEYK